MRTSIAVAVVAAITSTVAAYEYEEDIFAREAEPVLDMDHRPKWTGANTGSIKQGYNIKAHPQGNGYISGYPSQYKRDLEDLEELLAIREAEAEPFFEYNTAREQSSKDVGSFRDPYKQKGFLGLRDLEYTSQQYKRDLDTLEMLLAIRDAEAEADFKSVANGVAKWIGSTVNAKGSYSKKVTVGSPWSSSSVTVNGNNQGVSSSSVTVNGNNQGVSSSSVVVGRDLFDDEDYDYDF